MWPDEPVEYSTVLLLASKYEWDRKPLEEAPVGPILAGGVRWATSSELATWPGARAAR